MNKFGWMGVGVGVCFALVGLCWIVNFVLDWGPSPASDVTKDEVVTLSVPKKVPDSPYIGKRVTANSNQVKIPPGQEGTIVSVPGADDWCGEQGGFGIAWDGFVTKAHPFQCHWFIEFTVK